MPIRRRFAALVPTCLALTMLLGATALSAAPPAGFADAPLDPYYVHRDYPKLTTPQWVGEEGVDCVVTLAIDDMREPPKYEAYLRPILTRLQQIDGRAPVSIMTCRVDPRDPQLQAWLKEGLSIEVHTVDHPCPCLQGGDFAKARSTYERCVDLMHEIQGNKPVAFRMPCCDSLNTPSPRFWAEIFNRATPQGNHLTIDSSVFNIITGRDESLPREMRYDDSGAERFRRYIPFPSFVNTIEDYPYPYVIGGACWEFPCVVPSDWSAQHVQKPANPDTLRDWKIALDAAVLKKGTFNLVYHPYNWIRAEQVVQLIDHAVAKHGKKVKFLTFRECLDRLNQHLLDGRPLRNAQGGDNGVRLIDVDHDGYLDVVTGGSSDGSSGAKCRRWNPQSGRWEERPLAPTELLPAEALAAGTPRVAVDVDGDGRSECLAQTTAGVVALQQAQDGTWTKRPFTLPAPLTLVDSQGRDAGLRFHDLDGDGRKDAIFSNGQQYACYLFRNWEQGWSTLVVSGDRSDEQAAGPVIPPIVRADGSNNGAWFHSGHLWIQNEDTARLPNLVDRLAFDDLLRPLREREKKAGLPPTSVGAAKIDITPEFPVRLTGYGNRRKESEGVAQRLFAKAIAIGAEPAVLITFENCGLTPAIRAAVAGALREKAGIPDERIVISVSHSHTAPCLTDWAPYVFGEDLPPEHQAHVDQYTRELTGKLVQVALDAIQARRPARLSWGQGKVGFATNRRVLKDGKWTGFGVQADGPVDHSLPVLAARDENNRLIAVVANYACHCTTLGGEFNQICGDWYGYAQQYIEDDHPGCVALLTIGCGADANPGPRGNNLALCQQHGRALADEVKRLLAGPLTPLDPRLDCRKRTVPLPFAELPTKEQWEERAKQSGAPGYHARQFLRRLERGESIPTSLPYPVATWTFANDLAMVFLAGEVVVDYAIRLKDECDAKRLWITAYANEVPCYIASKRILREGGYEADFSMYYYARPARWSDDVEDVIVDTVQKLLPQWFYSAPKQSEFPPPKSPDEALAAIQVAPGFRVELVAAEPLVQDPVAFDWGPDGRLWVVEMRDYPNGIAWNGPGDPLGKPGGRVKRLTDTDGDGRYDRADLFLDEIPFPNGIKVWRAGVIVSAAPQVFYAEDRDGDGRADHRETLLEGFHPGNQQHRVNGLRWGLDNWLYLANGDSGGQIKSAKSGAALSVSGRDLRFRPDTGDFDAQSGQTQFGRNRNDWGDWFGGNNANPMWHYVLEDHYLRRNPHVAPPENRKHVSVQPGASPVFPASKTLARFNDFNMSNRFTSACSPEVYRDDLPFGVIASPPPRGDSSAPGSAEQQATGQAGPDAPVPVFICEPVHNLVHREIMTRDGVTFTSRRPEGETDREFFASSDNWSRPVMVRTGPDGALWIADMYRAVIEHPEWIPAAWQRKLDLRAGSDLGRIYRVVPVNAPARKLPRLHELDVPGLVAALDSSSGWQRDMVQQMLLWRNDPSAVAPLEKLAVESPRPEARLHALCTLDGLHRLTWTVTTAALSDRHSGVRRHAVRLIDTLRRDPTIDLRDDAPVLALLTQLTTDPDPAVRLQVAYTLGAWDERGGPLLAQLAVRHADDPYLTAAVLSSLQAENLRTTLTGVLAASNGRPPARLIEQLLAVATALGDRDIVSSTVATLLKPSGDRFAPWQFAAMSGMLEVLERRRVALDTLLADDARKQLDRLLADAHALAVNDSASATDRVAALRLLGGSPTNDPAELGRLAALLNARQPQEVQAAAVAALGRRRDERVPEVLTADWRAHSPSLRTIVLDTLLSRDDWTVALVGGIERRVVPAAQIDARRRQQLLTHKNAAVREAAARLLSSAGEPTRQKVVEQYRSALQLAGDAARGKAVFQKRCAACHRLDDTGHLVGPDIASIGNKSPDALLVAILDPNRAIEDKYLDYVVVTADGRSLTGILGGETATSITLLGQEGKSTTVLRTEIEQLASTGKSLMPEGMERDIPPQDLADLIAYVGRSGPPPKQFPGNQPEVVRADLGGAVRLLATAARIHGPTLVFEQQYRNLGYWSSVEDFASWSFEVPRAGSYQVTLDYACQDGAAGDRFVIQVGGQTLGGQVEGTGTWDNYRSKAIGTIELAAGPAQLIMRADGKVKSALIDLRAIRLSPK